MPKAVAPRARFLALVLSLAASGCSSSPSPQAFTLADGTEVKVDASGRFDVQVDGRSLFALSEKAPLESHAFEANVDTLLGGFSITRSNDVATSLDRLVSATKSGDEVVLTYAARSSGARTEVRIATDATDATRVTFTTSGDPTHRGLSVPLRCDSDATFLGFGAQYNATDQRGEAFDLLVEEQGIGRTGDSLATGDAHSTYFPVPYFLDARGFGVVVDTHAHVLVDLCKTDPTVARIDVETPSSFSMVVLHGPTPADVVKELGDRYGRPTAPPPTWAWGPWIGIQGGQTAVLDEAAALEAANVPYTALWAQDWVGMQPLSGSAIDIYYHWNVDTTLYPDLAGLTKTLHETHGVHFLGYVNPFVVKSLEHYAPMNAMGFLIHDVTGASYDYLSPKGATSQPDLTLAGARDYVKGFLATMATTYGMDGWMGDFGEWTPTDAVFSNGGDGIEEHNRYPTRWQAIQREALDAAHGHDYAVFTRSGWLGSQATTQIAWLGDQECSFSPTDGLPTVVPAMINLGLSGVPFVTHDIAGYFGGPSTDELFQRWTELGAFTSTMRTHEGLNALINVAWNSDATVLAHFARFARIHQALVPELDALALEATTTSMPVARHLVLVFPNDPNVRRISDEYMLGSTLLVAPVVTGSTTERDVYLPPGSWFHVWSGTHYDGGTTVRIAAPIGSPPVFSRDVDRPDLRAIL